MRYSATVVGRLDIAAAKGVKESTKRESVVTRAISRELPRKGTEMPREYNQALAQGVVEFKTRLAFDLQRNAEGASVVVNIDQGRKFDKVMVGFIQPGEPKVKLVLRYFIDRRDGSVYGIKSPVSPNTNHYYGTVHQSSLWDWSGDTAKPYDPAKAGVVQVGGYGANRGPGRPAYAHYVRKGSAVAPSEDTDELYAADAKEPELAGVA